MRNILLLGGFGFIGSNICSYIEEHLDKDYRIIVFDKFKTHAHGLKFRCIDRVYSGDFANENVIEQIFVENRIDFVIHLLSSTVPSTSDNAIYDVESNLIPTLKLLKLMKKYNVKDIVYFSSGGAIYGDSLMKVHNEDDAVYPKSSYGIVKLAIEKYILSYSELYGFNALILRLSNPYGRFHYNTKQGIVNIAVRNALSGVATQVWGNGEGVKDYIYIDDVCCILFLLVKNCISTEVLNIATGNAHSINEINEVIREHIPSYSWEHIKASLVDIESFELDITKLRNKIGSYRFVCLEEGIKNTIEWEKTTKFI